MYSTVIMHFHDGAFLLEEGNAYTRPVWISEFGRIW